VVEKQLKKWFSGRLLDWHATHNTRSMPWKGIKDPYRIWLSEVILQQTRVQQGLAYYQRFTERFSDVHALAKADEKEVFKLWEGLGYYSRCRNLIHTAKFVSVELKGAFPKTEEGLLALKGVGKYTAAAIGSFAFGLPLAVVDGNVMRVLSRFLGITDPIDQPFGKKRFEQLADELLGKSDPALYNQAIMDLGATFILMEKDEPLEEDVLKRLSEWDIVASGEKLISISTLLKHQLTHQKISCRFVHIRIDKRISINGYEWVTQQKIKSLAFPRLISRYLDSHFL